jgi:Predicted polymerase, most proteins contain PALM domain, HD hydrolase domain and Zn-ribbon domain
MYTEKFKNSMEFNYSDIPSVNGTVEIKDGILIVTDPSGEGEKASIAPGKNVRIIINGMETTGYTMVSKESDINITCLNEEPKREYSISISNDCMSAFGQAHYTDGTQDKLRDFPPALKTLIEAEIIQCACYTLDEVRDVLKDKGIVYGISDDNLAVSISRENSEHIIIAQGTKPVDGDDDSINLKFTNERKFEVINDRVDYYSIGKVSSVEPGALLAESISGTTGKPGINIFGKTFPAKQGKKITLRAGWGAKLSDDGLEAYSEVKGWPEMKDDMVSVHEVLSVDSNVDLSTGNIEFSRDVLIKGSITDGMKVKAGNSVCIGGDAMNCTITAGNAVDIKGNTIGSRVKAGSMDFVRHEIYDFLTLIEKRLAILMEAVYLVRSSGRVPGDHGDSEIVKLLLGTKFKDIGENIASMRDILLEDRDYIGREIIELWAVLAKFVSNNEPFKIKVYSDIEAYRNMVRDCVKNLENQLTESSNMFVHYVQSSNLTASGNIIVKGDCVYNSVLKCEGTVIFEKPGSIVRGSTITAKKDMRIYELGSQVGTPATACTDKDAVIYCEVAYENSIIKIGSAMKKIKEPLRRVKAFQHDGELVIEGLKYKI